MTDVQQQNIFNEDGKANCTACAKQFTCHLQHYGAQILIFLCFFSSNQKPESNRHTSRCNYNSYYFCFEFLETVVIWGGIRLLCNTGMKIVNFFFPLGIIRFLLQCCVTPEGKPENTLLKENVSNQYISFIVCPLTGKCF